MKIINTLKFWNKIIKKKNQNNKIVTFKNKLNYWSLNKKNKKLIICLKYTVSILKY